MRRQWRPTPVLLPGKSQGRRSLVGCSPWGRWELDTTERLHFHFSCHSLEKEMATHSRVLAWRIPVTGEAGGLLSMGSHRVGHDWSDLAAAAAVDTYLYVFTCLKMAVHDKVDHRLLIYLVDCIFRSFCNKQNEKLAIRKQQHKNQLAVFVLCGTFRFFWLLSRGLGPLCPGSFHILQDPLAWYNSNVACIVLLYVSKSPSIHAC